MLVDIACISILLLQYVTPQLHQRISERKCQEYSKIPRPSDSRIQPHLVWIRNATEVGFWIGGVGTLISDKFVLTSAATEIIISSSEVYFTRDEHYNIVEKLTHPLYNRTAHHNIALLRLETKIQLDSFHRPACLWTKNYFDSTHAEVMALKTWQNDFTSYNMKSLKIITGYGCSRLQPIINGSLFCLKPENVKDKRFIPRRGSPVQIFCPEDNLADNYFIYGIGVAFFRNKNDPFITVAVKMYDNLDWIEGQVWGNGNPDCGRIQCFFEPRLTFSMPTFFGEFPWHAAIFRLEDDGNRKYICGGSLTNANTVITAAHCVSNEMATTASNLLIVMLGIYNLNETTNDSRESYVDRVIVHEYYNSNYLENDIAILKLRTFVEYTNYIQPICVLNDRLNDLDNIGVAAGWGRDENNIPGNTLTKASLPILTNTECRNSNRNAFPSLLNDNNFCAGYANGTGVCSGDSGGGLIFKQDAQWYLRGIVSVGLSLTNSSQCDSTQPGIFTDVVKFYDWILERM